MSVTCSITCPESLVAIDIGIFAKSYSLSDQNILAAPPHPSLSSRSLDCVLEISALPQNCGWRYYLLSPFFLQYECTLHLRFFCFPQAQPPSSPSFIRSHCGVPNQSAYRIKSTPPQRPLDHRAPPRCLEFRLYRV